MKHKVLIITTMVFFLTVNTYYFWEGNLGPFAFHTYMFLTVVYIVLAIGLLGHLIFAVKEKFADRQRLFVITFLALILALTFLFPRGIINFDKLEEKDLLVAQLEGAANCTTTFKLKEDNKFVERSVCFGVTETKGIYKLKGDTIFFSNVVLARGDKSYYDFALIKKSVSQNQTILGYLVRYKNTRDTIGHELWIIKDDLTN